MKHEWDFIDTMGLGALCLGFGFIAVVAVKAYMVEKERQNQMVIVAEQRAAALAHEASNTVGAVSASFVGQLM